jgi:aminomethyltransferase
VSSVDEHLAVRRSAGLFDFSFMALHEFPLDLLERLQMRNLRDMKGGQIVYTLLLKPDGAVLIDATVWRVDADRFWLFAGKRGTYGGRERSDEFTILALQGPASGVILSRLISREAVLSLRYFHFLERNGLLVGRIGYSGELGYELLIPAAEGPALRRRILEVGRNEGLRECGWAAADSLRIESGYVLFDREVDGRANPAELGLERLAPGKAFAVKRRLAGLEVLDEPGRPDLPQAQVTSECFSPTLGKTLALGFAPPGLAKGSLVRTNGRIARVASLPFYDPERRRVRGAAL